MDMRKSTEPLRLSCGPRELQDRDPPRANTSFLTQKGPTRVENNALFNPCILAALDRDRVHLYACKLSQDRTVSPPTKAASAPALGAGQGTRCPPQLRGCSVTGAAPTVYWDGQSSTGGLDVCFQAGMLPAPNLAKEAGSWRESIRFAPPIHWHRVLPAASAPLLPLAG